ncbi:hypothetical protein KCU96_g37, partial [Aureobasidium melanogenum]
LYYNYTMGETATSKLPIFLLFLCVSQGNERADLTGRLLCSHTTQITFQTHLLTSIYQFSKRTRSFGATKGQHYP